MGEVVTGSWSAEDDGFSIIVHGGAGHVPEASRAAHAEGARRAAMAGFEVLRRGGSAVEAVERAVKVLEDDPVFNAGTGACLNSDGHIELDAAIMSGADLSAGAVTALPPFRNPIAIARAVLQARGHILYAGEGAVRFARAHGFAPEEESRMVTEAARKRLAAVQSGETDNWAGGTVGAVARDRDGHVCAGTSTGGKVNKRPGRVGDTPIIGAGTYADDECGACSNTGDGEAFMRLCFAKTVLDAMRGGKPAEEAAREGLALLTSRGRGSGGTILVNPRGHLAWARTTATMSWAAMSEQWSDPRFGT